MTCTAAAGGVGVAQVQALPVTHVAAIGQRQRTLCTSACEAGAEGRSPQQPCDTPCT